MSATPEQYNLTNLFIPAGGVVHAVALDGPFSNSPETIQWQQFKIDNFPFVPQGVYMDNTQGAVDLTVTIMPIGWKMTCKAGEQRVCNFPSPQQGSVIYQGDPANNSARLVFVDFPVFPDSWR